MRRYAIGLSVFLTTAFALGACRSAGPGSRDPAVSAPTEFVDLLDAGWSKENPPKDTPYIALGFFTRGRFDATPLLDRFVGEMQKRLGHEIVTIISFDRAGYGSAQGDYVDKVERAIKIAMARAPRIKVVLFNLTNFDPKVAFGREGGLPGPEDWTSREAHMILTHEDYYRATRWFKDGRELSPRDVRDFFQFKQ